MKEDDDTPTRSVSEILREHGMMHVDVELIIDRDELRKGLRNPRGARTFLSTRRKKAHPEDETRTWRALFVLYGIPNEWSRVDKLEWLAGRLAAERFKRCQALLEPHGGGPSEKYQQKMKELKARLREEFNAFRQRCSALSARSAAQVFMRKNKEACETAGFTSAKAFAQAMKGSGSATLR